MTILSNIRNEFARRGVYLSKVTQDDDLMAFFRLVRPTAVDKPFIRIGGDFDGGYVAPDDLEGIEVCFSPGVSDIATFENALAARGIRSFLADYSVEQAPISDRMISFQKKFLGVSDDETFMRLETWVRNNSVDGDLILQMDIEGAEYEVILDTPRDVLHRFRILIIEFHGMERLFDRESFGTIRQVFKKLLESHYICHIHPNNADPAWSVRNFTVPRTLEFTFLRRDRSAVGMQPLSFPHALDMPNIPDKKDIVLPECWHKAALEE